MTKIKNLIKLINLIGANKYYVLFLVALMLISSVLDLISLGLIAPYISSIFELENNSTNNIISKIYKFDEIESEQLILFFTIFLIIIFFLKAVFSIIIRWLISLFAFKQYAKLQVKLMSAYQNMRYEDYILRSTSEYIRNVRELCSDCLSNIDSMLRVISELIIFLAIIVFLALLNFKILLFLILIIIPIFFIYEIILKPINLKLGREKVDAAKQMYKNIDSGMRGLKEIRILSKENFFTEKLSIFGHKIFRTQKISSLITDSPRYVFEFFVVSSALIVFMILSYNSLDFKNYLPSLGVFLLAGLRLLPSLSLITSSLSRIGYVQYSVERVCEDLEKYYRNNKANIKKTKNNNNEFQSIKLDNVSFNYKNINKKIFQNITFSINRNNCIGIVGESGSGKTTLVDLLLGLLNPTEGKILLNNISMENPSQLFHGEIAYLPQDPIILDEDIKTNVTLFSDEKKIDNEKLIQALKRANINNVVSKLPNKLNTILGEGGVRLSGGQNKRLALARAFYHGKNVVIMDEATSSLDIESENYIAEQIKDLKGNFTIIIISHHLNILKYCDKIYKVENNKINLLRND
tara:strand:+ start:89 stop:1825 length:1737 start_codon:yes stop_codon:yes gene_type:complete